MANTLHQFEFVQVDQKNEINPTRIETLAKSLGSDETKWAQCWLELTWLAIDGIMPAEKVVSCMRGLATAAASIKPASKIPEALWFVGMEVRNFESEEEKMLSAEWKRLVSLVNAVMQAGIVDKAALLEQLEFDLIGACGWGPNLSLEKLNKAMVKANTNALYRQRKYNLLGEESEGFAKLITELETLHAGNISAVVENMQRLIGYFRLDPNRVFDIILEVFETDPDNEAFIPLLSHFRISNLKQLLGFKFQAYHPPPAAVPASQDTAADTISQPGADATNASPNTTADLPKPTPLSLYLLTAKLCVRGDKKLLALQDIMPHLYPPPRDLSAMARERERRIHQSMREIGVVHLRTRTPEEIMAEEQEKMAKQAALKARIDFEDITNQKYGLVAGFLAAGYWDEALELASSLNTDAAFDHPQVLSVLFAQLHAAVEPLYRSFRVPLGALTAQLKANNKDFASNDSANSMAETTSRFSPVHTLDEFFERLSDVLGVLGHRIHKDVVLLTKIVRIARAQATAPGDVTVARKRKLIRMVSHTLLPGATLLSTPNPPLMLELWETIKDFPFTVRFDLYEIQRSDLYERVPDLKMARVQTAHEAKQTLKRVANNKEVMRLISRRLGKLSHNSPIVTLSAILKNIQAYDNLIGSMVDAIKYLSPLSYDVLAYLLIVFLGKDESLKIKDDGQSHSNWLQALCKFAGFFYAKYPTVELRGLFEYLARQLSLKQTLDLLTLEELISRMAGLEIIENVSDATLAAMGGGEKLRTQIRAAMGTTNIIKKKPINALRSVLEENSLIMPLLVLIAQQQQTTLFDAKDKNLKLVGHKHDKCASVLEQFVEFLALQVPVQELADKHMLPVAELCERFHIEPVVAFHIVRPLIAAALHQVFFADSDSAFKGSCAESRWSLKDEALRRWRPDSTELRDMAQAQINARTKRKLLSPDLYLMFWSLQLYDISVPRAQYDEEIERLKERAAGLKSGAIDPGLTDKKRKVEVQRCEDSIDPLEQELHQQTENRTFVLKHFDAGKASWIPIRNSDGEPIPAPVNLFALTEFLHVCILPRALYSMTDALYSARFIRLLHDRNVPNCPTAFIYKKALQFVVANMVCVTEREAENLGIFLKNLLDHLAAWCKDRKTFQAQFESKSGAFRKFTDPSSPKISFDEFTKLVRKFHENIMNLSISSLASSSYMQIRTALLITAKIGDLFPTHKSSALALRKEAKKLIETDGRQDIVTMARRYEAFLDSRVRGDKLVLDVKDSPSDKKPPAKKGDSGESNSKKSENTLAQEATSTSSSENASKTSGKESSDKSQSEKSTAASNRNTNSKSSKNSNQGKPKDNGNNKQSAAGGTTKASVSKSAPGSQNRNKDGRDISETTKSAVVAGNNNSNAAPTASSSSSSSSNENLNKGASSDAQSQNKGAAKKRARDDSSPSRSRGNDGADSKRARVDQDRRSPSRPSRTDRSGRRGGRNASPSSSHYRGDDRRDWGRDHRDRYPRDRDNRDWEYRDPRDRDFRDNRDTRGRNRDHGRDASRSRGDRRDSPARPDSRNSGPSGPNSTAGNTNNNNNKPTNSNKDGPRNTGSGDNNNTNNNNNNNNNYNNGNNNKGRNDGGARRGRRRGGGGVGGGRR